MSKHKLTLNQIEVLSHLFSSKVISQLAKGEHLNFLAKFLKEAKLTKSHIKVFETLGSFFNIIFEALSNSKYRNEYIYKSAIIHKRLLGVHSLRTTTLLNEFRAGASKADVVVLNSTSTVYEIKSERDSLARLSSQLADYQKVFTHINVITSEEQVASILKATPKHIGVLCLTNRYHISTIREASECCEFLNSVSMFNSLRRDEAQDILRNIGLSLPNVPNTLIHQKLSELFEKLEPNLVHDEMIKVLKTTRSQIELKDFIDTMPKSLQAIVFFKSFKQIEQKTLIELMDKPFELMVSSGEL